MFRFIFMTAYEETIRSIFNLMYTYQQHRGQSYAILLWLSPHGPNGSKRATGNRLLAAGGRFFFTRQLQHGPGTCAKAVPDKTNLWLSRRFCGYPIGRLHFESIDHLTVAKSTCGRSTWKRLSGEWTLKFLAMSNRRHHWSSGLVIDNHRHAVVFATGASRLDQCLKLPPVSWSFSFANGGRLDAILRICSGNSY